MLSLSKFIGTVVAPHPEYAIDPPFLSVIMIHCSSSITCSCIEVMTPDLLRMLSSRTMFIKRFPQITISPIQSYILQFFVLTHHQRVQIQYYVFWYKV